MLTGHLYIFLEKCLFRYFAQVLIGLLFISELQEFFIYSKNNMTCAYFLPFCGLSFHILDAKSILGITEVLLLTQSNLSKKSLPNSGSPRFTSTFSSKSFIILALTFKILIWVIFCVWYEEGVQIHSFACGYVALFVKIIFPLNLSWHSCSKLIQHKY